MIIEPGKKFIITRQLGDPADTGTYYVRAFIRNAETDTLLATVNLTDKGDQRFRGEWNVPYKQIDDYFITITSFVYTDSGYTTESEDYERVEDQYQVAQKQLGGGGGGGTIVKKPDYNEIRKIIKEEIEIIKFPELKVDLSPIISNLNEVIESVEAIKNKEYPKQEKIDLNPILEKILGIEREITFLNKKASLLENTDLNPVISYMQDLDASIKDKKEITELQNKLLDLSKSLEEFITEVKAPKLKSFEEVISEIKHFNDKRPSHKLRRKFI